MPRWGHGGLHIHEAATFSVINPLGEDLTKSYASCRTDLRHGKTYSRDVSS